MPEIVGRLRPPRLSTPPASPAVGEMYYDVDDNILYFWDGTAWISTKSTMGTIYDSDQIGTVKSFTGTVIPTNWMLADGRTLNRVDYPELADAMGISAGATTFALPDLRNKFIYGASAPSGSPWSGGGAATVLLTAAESGLPAHAHVSPYYTNRNLSGVGGTGGNEASNQGDSGGGRIQAVDSIVAANASAAHNNMPPYILLAQIIKVTGAQIDSGGALVGATGAQGPSGVITSYGIRLHYCTATPITAATWTKMKLSGPLQSLIDPAGEFVVGVDDSVSPLRAGWYDVAASIVDLLGTSTQIHIAISRNATPTEGDIANATGGPVGYARVSASGHIYLNAGEKVYVHAYLGINTTTTTRVYDFSMVRAGAGPQGTPGGVAIPFSGCKAMRATELTIPNAAWTIPTFDSEEFDTDACHDNVTNSGRLYCRAAGRYQYAIYLPASCTAYGTLVAVGVSRQGSVSLGISGDNAAFPGGIGLQYSTSGMTTLALGDWLEASIYQNGTGVFKILVNAWFAMWRVG